jgi:amino acid transporter
MDSKYIKWSTLAFMAFSTVWGFGNVLNGFVYFNGIQVIFSWIFMFALYFIPYALMVGELGSAFKESGGGVSSWILKTTGPKLAYYAGWTYWACHITYIASKSSGGLKALSWAVFRNAETYDTFPTIGVQLVTFAVGRQQGIKAPLTVEHERVILEAVRMVIHVTTIEEKGAVL